MASTYSPILRLNEQGTGDNVNTWGSVLNGGVIELVDFSIAGAATIALTNVDVTLTTASGATDQARASALILTGTLTGDVNIKVPALTKPYIVYNNTTGAHTVTVKTAAGTGVAVTQGGAYPVWCDGTNVQKALALGGNADTLGGVAAASYARRDAANTYTAINTFGQVALTSAPGIALSGSNYNTDASLGNFFPVAMTGAGTLTNPTNLPSAVQGLTWRLKQDATGGRTLAYGAMFKFLNSATPTLSTAANAVDMIQGLYVPADSVIYCTFLPNFG